MMRTARSFIVAIAVMGISLAVTAARAGDVQILKSAVSNSVDADGVPQLDLHLLVNTSSSEPTSIIAYFLNGETGQPLGAPSGSEFSTKSGHLAARSATLPGTSKSVMYEETISIPHFVFDFQEKKRNRVKISFFLDPGNASDSDELEFADELGFDFTVQNPFGHGKHGKKKRLIDVVRPNIRMLLPDRPTFRSDALGRWNAYTAFQVDLPPALARQVSTTVLVEDGRTVSLGGGLKWMHEGSGPTWQNVYDAIGASSGIVLPKVRAELNGDRFPPKQIMVNARILEINGHVVPATPSSGPSSLGNQPGPQILIDSKIVEVGHRDVLFDFDANRVEAESRVPILGDIPTLGQLFVRKQALRDKRTLLVFVTTALVQPGEE